MYLTEDCSKLAVEINTKLTINSAIIELDLCGLEAPKPFGANYVHCTQRSDIWHAIRKNFNFHSSFGLFWFSVSFHWFIGSFGTRNHFRVLISVFVFFVMLCHMWWPCYDSVAEFCRRNNENKLRTNFRLCYVIVRTPPACPPSWKKIPPRLGTRPQTPAW